MTFIESKYTILKNPNIEASGSIINRYIIEKSSALPHEPVNSPVLLLEYLRLRRKEAGNGIVFQGAII
jgi:hypothetical protein